MCPLSQNPGVSDILRLGPLISRILVALGVATMAFHPAQAQNRTSRPVAKAPVAPVVLVRGDTDLFAATLAGRFAQGTSDPVLAARAWSRAYRNQPNDSELLTRALDANLQAGFVDDAIALARTAPAATRTDDAALILAVDALAKGRYVDVSRVLSGRNYLPSRRIIADHLAAYALLGEGKVEASVSVSGTSTGIAVLDKASLMSRALILEAANRNEEAAILFRSAIEANIKWPIGVRAYARFLLTAGRKPEAIALYRQLINAGGTTATGFVAALSEIEAQTAPIPAPELRARAAIGLAIMAQSLIAEGRSGPPSALLSLIAHIDPRSDAIALVLASQWIDDNKEGLARATLANIEPASSSYLAARTELAWLDFASDKSGAVQIARDTFAARPRDEAAKRLLADILAANRNDREAEELYTQLINAGRASGRRDDELWPMYYGRGGARERQDKWPEARADLRLAKSAVPNQPNVLNSLGYALAERGENIDEALSMLRTAVRLRPRSASILDSLGWAQFRAGRFEEAVTTLERAAGMDSTIAEISHHLGDAYWRTGRQDEARLEWQRTLRILEDDAQKTIVTRKLRDGLPAL